jgi:class 3 adenylate cyclase
MTAATADEIAALRRRYLWMATSVAFLDLAITLIFAAATSIWGNLWLTGGIGLTLMLGVNWLIARRLFEPIRLFLEGRATFESAERRLTQLPLLTARYVGILTFLVAAFRLSTAYWNATVANLATPTIADFITTCVVLTVFFFTYTYFVVSDYLTQLCDFIFSRYGRNLSLFFGSYTLKLVVALLVISVVPMAAIVVDFYSYSGERQQAEILVDVSAAVLGVAISAFFIGRSLLRPLGALSRAMTEVAGGKLDIQVPVTSNDEVGELTGRFNRMVEGLRERVQIRETFGRYVDEGVAATILRRQGEGTLAGETGEATILFSDIAGFTTIAEYLTPHTLVATLNEYLETVLEPIRAHGGVVNTFIGDGLFASFNMPLACEDHAAAAVRAAIDIQRAVGGRTFGSEGVALDTRIGISTGNVIGGSVGAGQRLSFTLLGDTVNLAARLEELNKQFGTRILVSQSTHEACGKRFVFKPLGSVAVRGRTDRVAVFSVDHKGQEKPS